MTKNILTYYDFIHATQIGDLDTIQSYQKQGADIHAQNDAAFRLSATKGRLPIVQFLLQQGADIHAKNDEAFRLSSEKGYLPIVQFFLPQGANIHAENDEAIRYSAWEGYLTIVQFLLQHGADIHVGIAASSDQPKVLAWLLSYQHALEEKILFTNHLTTLERDASPEYDIIQPTLPSKIRL